MATEFIAAVSSCSPSFASEGFAVAFPAYAESPTIFFDALNSGTGIFDSPYSGICLSPAANLSKRVFLDGG